MCLQKIAMNSPSYEIIEIASDFSEYKFISRGPKGDILKLIVFKKIFIESLYNLSLLDVMQDGSLSDTTSSNNDDLRKILSTIIQVIGDYTYRFPERSIFFQGSDDGRRMTLYQKAITNHLFILEPDYLIVGIKDGKEEDFDPAETYDAILVKRK